MQQMNLKEYFQSLQQEMSNFYSQHKIQPIEEVCFEEKKVQQKQHQRKPSEPIIERKEMSFVENEFIAQPIINEYQDTFDEIPIKGAQKTFEELLQDQGVVPQEKKDKKQFLKKGTRQYLSNAQVRSELSKKEHEEIIKMNSENVAEQQPQQKKQSIHFLQKGKGKQCMQQKLNDSNLDRSKIDDSFVEEKQEPDKLKKEKSQFEAQQKELAKQRVLWQKQMDTEKQEFEKWKEEEKKKIERLKQKHYTSQQLRLQQLTTKQLEELDYLRKKVQQQNDEIKELKLQLEKVLNNKSQPVNGSSPLKVVSNIETKLNSYAVIHQKQSFIDEQDEFEDQEDQEDEDEQEVQEFESDNQQENNQNEKIDLFTLKNQQGISIDLIGEQVSEKEFIYKNNKYYQTYLEYQKSEDKVIQQTSGTDGKIQRVYQSGKKEVIFSNGVKREVFADGFTIVHFQNEDIKQTFPDGTTVYFFSKAQTTQITFQNGPNIYRFINNQIEIHFQDNGKQIRFPDGTKKYIYSNGEEETLYSDGTFQKIEKNKEKKTQYPDGKIEIQFPNGRCQITYPDGRVEITQPDNTVETTYPDGKFKIIHPNGKVETFTENKNDKSINKKKY